MRSGGNGLERHTHKIHDHPSEQVEHDHDDLCSAVALEQERHAVGQRDDRSAKQEEAQVSAAEILAHEVAVAVCQHNERGEADGDGEVQQVPQQRADPVAGNTNPTDDLLVFSFHLAFLDHKHSDSGWDEGETNADDNRRKRSIQVLDLPSLFGSKIERVQGSADGVVGGLLEVGGRGQVHENRQGMVAGDVGEDVAARVEERELVWGVDSSVSRRREVVSAVEELVREVLEVRVRLF
mmetsp:Transcript_39266/g.77220  ORF Transcript_39266/g.77220 Transcript_39266/m.77220 type:complete len:238 (-) Transcript_39266:1604-2317(-)